MGDGKSGETSQSDEDPEVAKARRVAAAQALIEKKKDVVKQQKMEQALVQLELNNILDNIKPSSKKEKKKSRKMKSIDLKKTKSLIVY